MKIGFSGYHASGKTTAAHEIVAQIKRSSYTCSLVTGAARSSRRLAAGDFGVDMHLEIIGLQLVLELRASQNSTHVVCDRTMLDYLAYGECRNLASSELGELFSSAKGFCRSYLRSFDAIFIVDGSFGNVDFDEARVVNDVLEAEFMMSLNRLVEEFGIQEMVHVSPANELSSRVSAWVQKRFEVAN